MAGVDGNRLGRRNRGETVPDGDPLRDLLLLTRQGAHMPLIVKGGEIVKHVYWGWLMRH
jgi:hypothetical protein